MAGTAHDKELITGGPVIVLVEPQLGENIGMCARAMANFGLSEMRLVNPRDGWPSESARSAASKADHVIDGVKVFDTLQEAIADLNFVLATTARERGMNKAVHGPQEASAMMQQREASGQKCGFLFGRERWGLKNWEVSLCDAIVTFPVNPAFASLNIAQAVLLMSYEWMNAVQKGDAAAPEVGFEAPEYLPATKDDMNGLLGHLVEALDRRNYFWPEPKREVLIQNLHNTFSKANLTQSEVHNLRGVIATFDRRKKRAQEGYEIETAQERADAGDAES